jgi:hypothetical protein
LAGLEKVGVRNIGWIVVCCRVVLLSSKLAARSESESLLFANVTLVGVLAVLLEVEVEVVLVVLLGLDVMVGMSSVAALGLLLLLFVAVSLLLFVLSVAFLMILLMFACLSHFNSSRAASWSKSISFSECNKERIFLCWIFSSSCLVSPMKRKY